jgi:(5-formylfuran-3-yl)methyl phosphate synthase
MRLLVSVANVDEAAAALAGGADIIDAKDPHAGALGAVPARVLREIRTAVGEARPVTAAIGDASDEIAVERIAHEFAAAGATLLKVGFAGIDSASRISALLAAAIRGAAGATDGLCGVVAVAYADADGGRSLTFPKLLEVAASSRAWGLLVDTLDKAGPGLCQLVRAQPVAQWVSDAHRAGLVVALAGKLTADDLPFVRDTGADIAGVRGAACEDGRAGHVSADRVRLLQLACTSAPVRA